MFKVLDGSDVNKLTHGSHKKVSFICDCCPTEVVQPYKTYVLHNEHFCRKCRNLHTANRQDVKLKQSIASKEKWLNIEYRKNICDKVSFARKEEWRLGKRKAYNKTKYNDFKSSIELEGYTLLTTKEEYDVVGNNSVTVKCNNGHIYKTHAGKWNNGCRCKKCSGSERHEYLHIKSLIELESGYKLLATNYINNSTPFEIECNKGHQYKSSLIGWNGGNRCPKCAKGCHKTEQEIKDFFTHLGLTFLENNRKLITPHELDIVFPDKKIAVEYCGFHWHGENLMTTDGEVKKNKDKSYHMNKLEKCNEIGYKLITIFSDEWLTKKDIVKDRLKHIILKSSERIYARKCVISEITSKQASGFVNKHHMQGYTGCRIKLGAFYENRLVAVMTFAVGSISKGEHTEKNIWELSRFCVDGNVIGIAGKLFEYFKKNYEWTKIFSYADRRWSDGNIYKALGLNFIHNTSPNYWYFKEDNKRTHRFNFRKDKIKHLGNGEQTEWEIMQEQGWNRIWDCGSMKFEIRK